MFMREVTESPWFDHFIMFTITMNGLFMALETDYHIKYTLYNFLEVGEGLPKETYLQLFTLSTLDL